MTALGAEDWAGAQGRFTKRRPAREPSCRRTGEAHYLAAVSRDSETDHGSQACSNLLPAGRRMSDAVAFLNELAVAVQKHAMYPVGHPALRTVSGDLALRLEEVLADDAALTIGVARNRLTVGELVMEPGRPLVDSLAAHLHGHQIAALHFVRGAGTEELDGMLRELAVDADRRGGPIGLEPVEKLPTWPHIRIQPVQYEALRLGEGTAEDVADQDFVAPTPGGHETSAALAESEAEVDRAAAELANVELSPELLELVGELDATHVDPETLTMLSELLREMPPDELKRVLGSRDAAFTAKLIRHSTSRLSPKAVVELVEAASSSESRPIGPWLMRLLTKLAYYAESDPSEAQSESDEMLRAVVHELVDDWELEDPRPAPYRSALGQLARETVRSEEGERPFFGDRLVMIGLELEMMGRMVAFALKDLCGQNLTELIGLLEATSEDSQVGEVMWRQVATRETLEQLLRDEAPDFGTVDRLLRRIGLGATEPLLDALQRASDPQVRSELVERLIRSGPVIAGAVIARMDADKPKATAHLLSILNELDVQTPGLSVAPFLEHPDLDVRGEAYRLAVRHHRDLEAAIWASLAESNPRLLAIGLTAAAKTHPPGAEALLRAHVLDSALPVRLRVKAVRALSGYRTEAALDALVKGATQRRWLLQRRIAPPSPVVLEALASIRREYRHLPRARDVLDEAGGSADRSIRVAAGVEPGSETR